MTVRDSIRFNVLIKRKSKSDALITMSTKKTVKIKRTLRNNVEL